MSAPGEPGPSTGMTAQQARGGHCISGGTITSGNAVCQCGTWAAADAPDPASRKVSRKSHLGLVEAMRRAAPRIRDHGTLANPKKRIEGAPA